MARAKPRAPHVERLSGEAPGRLIRGGEKASEPDPCLEPISIKAPSGCSATLLLKLVDRVTVDDNKKEAHYVVWLVVGRYKEDSISVTYCRTAEEVLRFDIPDDTLVTPEYLQKYLEKFKKEDPSYPDDTPVIKG